MVGVNDQYGGRPLASYERTSGRCCSGRRRSGGEPARVPVLSIPDYGVTRFARRQGLDAAVVAAEPATFDAAARGHRAAGARWIDVTALSRRAAGELTSSPPTACPAAKLHMSGPKALAAALAALNPIMRRRRVRSGTVSCAGERRWCARAAPYRSWRAGRFASTPSRMSGRAVPPRPRQQVAPPPPQLGGQAASGGDRQWRQRQAPGVVAARQPQRVRQRRGDAWRRWREAVLAPVASLATGWAAKSSRIVRLGAGAAHRRVERPHPAPAATPAASRA
jgi:hypothetical protein